MTQKIDPQRARQARKGWRVFAVLAGSLALAFIALIVADAYFFKVPPGSNQLPAEHAQAGSLNPTTPEQHLDNPSHAVPQQTKPLPKDLGRKPPGSSAR